MTIENLVELNQLAQNVIENAYPPISDEPPITAEVMFPVAVAILDSLVREHLPPVFGQDPYKVLVCTIGIEGKVLQTAHKLLLENRNATKVEGSSKSFSQEFGVYSRLEDRFVNSLLYSTFNYLFGLNLHQMAPAGVCSNSEKSLFTLTMEITADDLTQAMNRFITHNQMAMAEATEREYKSRLLSGVENTNAYVKSMNDKLNEVSAIVNDFRREIVGLTESVSRGVNKLLDLVTPLTVSKKSSVKKDKTK